MGIPASFAPFVVSNEGAWEEDSEGWFSSTLNRDNKPTSFLPLVLELQKGMELNVGSLGFGMDNNTVYTEDYLLILNSLGVELQRLYSYKEDHLFQVAETGEYSFIWKSNAGKSWVSDNRARIKLNFIFYGDFKTITQADYDTCVKPSLVGESSLSEGVGLQVADVAYYPAAQFLISDTCAILDANNNVLFEYTGECYSVINGTYLYLFDENRTLLFSYPDAQSYIKMQGLVEQVNIADHTNDYSAEIFKSQIHFSAVLPPWFANQNQTREQANPTPNVTNKLIANTKTDFLPAHDRLTIYDQNGDMYLAGKITGTVKEQDVPVAKKVLCFTEYGQLVAETMSDKFGNYEFKNLKHNIKYMITAKAGHAPNTPPDFHPDTVGYITPEVYKL